MKTRIKKLMVMLLSASMLLSGCTFVTKEEVVLINPRDESDVVASDTKGETQEDNVVGMPETSQGDEQETPSQGDEQETPSGNDTVQSGTTVVKNNEPKLSGKLEIQISTNESDTQSQAWTTVLNTFEKETGVKVTAHIGQHVNAQMSKRWLGGNPPDIALLSGSGIPDMALEQGGILYDMADLLKNGYVYGTDEKIWDVVEHNMMWRSNEQEKYYRAGIVAGAYGVFYDEAYMKQLGLSAPTNYTELMNFVSAMNNKGVPVYTTYGSGGSYALWSLIMPALAAYGQDFLDDICLGKASAWRSAEAKSVLQRYYDFCQKDGAVLTGTITFDHSMSQMKWLKHESALVGSGIWLPWEVGKLIPSGFQMQYVGSPLKLADQKTTIVANSSCMMIAAQAKNLENAKAFLRFLYRKDIQEILSGSFGYLGARKDINYANVPGLDSDSKRILTYITSNQVNLTYQKYTWGDLNTEVTGAAAALMSNTMTVDEAIEYIASKGR